MRAKSDIPEVEKGDFIMPVRSAGGGNRFESRYMIPENLGRCDDILLLMETRCYAELLEQYEFSDIDRIGIE